jgi:DNA-binding CsgD family transcriptional regulator
VTYAAYLRENEVDLALGVVAEAAATRGAEPFSLDVIRELLRLIPADRAGYFEYGLARPEVSDLLMWDGTGPRYWVEEPEFAFGWDDDVVCAAIGSMPLHDIRSRETAAAMRASDVLTRAQLRRNPWYATVLRPRSVEHEVKLWLSSPRHCVRGFFFVRGPQDRDFNEQECALLTVLRRHLSAARERWERRQPSKALTARELEVMRLVADGSTNRQVARRLVVSDATVRTHLEHVFEKLGVHTRTAAVAQVFGTD